MNPFYIVLILCGGALLALLLNLRKKLPKYIFLFFAVSIVVSVSWYAMTANDSGEVDSFLKPEVSAAGSLVFMKVDHNLVISAGETRFSVPVVFSGKRSADCIRFVLASDEASFTEQAFVKNVCFSLLASDGTSISPSWIQISKEENFSFPESFVLKIFFDLPENLNSSEFRCIVENGLKTVFRVSEISVASVPLLSENKQG